MAPHSSTLAWKIPRTEEPGRLQSMGCKELADSKFKTATQEPTDLIFRGHINSKCTHRTIPSQRNSQIS